LYHNKKNFSSKFAKNHEDFLSNQISKIHILKKTHTKFCKFVLGVRAKSSDDAVRGEMGSYPILYNILLNKSTGLTV
jgi:hypothetical protein